MGWNQISAQCILKTVTVHPQKLDLEIFELQEFPTGSRNRKEWLRGLDSNQDNQLQRLACYQLHYPGTGYESVADLPPICYQQRLLKIPIARAADCCFALDLLRCLRCTTAERCPSGLRSTLGKRV